MATNAFNLAMRLIIDGCVVVPDVLVGDELKAMQDAFVVGLVMLGRVLFSAHAALLRFVRPRITYVRRGRCQASRTLGSPA